MSADLFTVTPMNAAAIAGMALVTLATRWAGYLLVGRFRIEGRLKGALEAVPPAILTALVVPVSLAEGPAETLAAAVTVLAAWRLPTLAAVVIGVGAVVLLRMAIAGTIVMKMPANSFPTSTIGNQVNPFASRLSREVRIQDSTARPSSSPSRITF